MRIENLSLRFKDKTVFDRCTLDIPAGRVTFLLGPSGVGKTSLLRVLLGLQKSDDGKLIGLPEKKSIVFQEDRLIPGLDIRRNLRFVTENDPKQELIAGLGLESYLEQPIASMSGGTKRRVAILRALTADYDLLLLDEPFTGLDAETKVKVANTIAKQVDGATVIIATHDKDTIEYFEEAHIVELS